MTMAGHGKVREAGESVPLILSLSSGCCRASFGAFNDTRFEHGRVERSDAASLPGTDALDAEGMRTVPVPIPQRPRREA